MQAGKGQLHLRLDPGSPDNCEGCGTLGRVTQQCCLTYPRLAPQHQHRAPTRPRIR